ncbi:diguanylate cyclase [Mobilitalea sibirica]|uniref:Diguanylate cyclase n=1 Tax=Mobilitalea sibirica TaxID=1462919 RepID=A0A8J7H7G2_9FIRM|nr:NifB/NifX family molybdenum-iron cluster-binding protein [Mobilitalea sibirica]MBH1939425.1 diguanylate cyclase [Mobilitalea sibirica]
MIVAISAVGKNKNDNLDGRFGRCECFHIIDTEKSNLRIMSNKGAASGGGAGIAAASQLIEEGVDVIITGSLGPNAYELVEKSGIKAYSCDMVPVQEAVKMLEKNLLTPIKKAGVAHHGISG